MSQPSSNNPGGVYVKKAKWDIYTSLLLTALVALIIGITMLCMEMARYEWKFKRSEAVRATIDLPVEAPVLL